MSRVFMVILLFLLILPTSLIAVSERIEEIIPFFDNYVQNNMEKWMIPGMAVGIVADGELIFAKGYGVKDIDLDEAVTPETIFQIGSTSKAFTSFLVGQLVDEGVINWKDKVVDHFPEFQMYDPWVTSNFLIEDLMAQHSGLPPYSGDLASILNFSRDEIIEKIRLIPPENTFRTDFAYQNNLFLVAAKIVENYTGLSWEENVKRKIFDILGMYESSNTAEDYRKTGNFATTYELYNGEITKLEFDGNLFKFPYVYGPAGGINSNIIDMSKWLALQMNGGSIDDNILLSGEQYNFIHSPATLAINNDSKIIFYCQGWIYEQRKDYKVFWHNGGTAGCKTMIAYLPDDDLGIIVLSNLGGTELPDLLAYVLFDLYKGKKFEDYSAVYLKSLMENPDEEREENVEITTALPFENYMGDYYNEFFGKVSINSDEEHLIMNIDGKNLSFDLYHLNRDNFVIDNSDIIELNGGVISFVIDENGFAKSMSFSEGIVTNGIGTLDRVK
ncbi:MAG: hypothetical protein PWQ77_1898 [Kosmotogales bacterium]|nr:hypothetical protein [Kosmotogales bacterium]